MPLQVTFGPSGLPGYVVGDTKDPAVIVIQEWWGIIGTVADHAVRISEQGYRCALRLRLRPAPCALL